MHRIPTSATLAYHSPNRGGCPKAFRQKPKKQNTKHKPKDRTIKRPKETEIPLPKGYSLQAYNSGMFWICMVEGGLAHELAHGVQGQLAV
jgi:hypothetical protein